MLGLRARMLRLKELVAQAQDQIEKLSPEYPPGHEVVGQLVGITEEMGDLLEPADVDGEVASVLGKRGVDQPRPDGMVDVIVAIRTTPEVAKALKDGTIRTFSMTGSINGHAETVHWDAPVEQPCQPQLQHKPPPTSAPGLPAPRPKPSLATVLAQAHKIRGHAIGQNIGATTAELDWRTEALKLAELVLAALEE